MLPTTGALRFLNQLYRAHYRASVHKFLTLLSGSEGQGWMSSFLSYFLGKLFPSNGYSMCVFITSKTHCGHSWIRNGYQPNSETFSCDDVLLLVLLWGAYETKEGNSCSCIIPQWLSWPQRFSLLVLGKMPWQHCRRNNGFQSLLLPSVWTVCFSHQTWRVQHILWALLLQKYFQGIYFHVCLGEKNGTGFILGDRNAKNHHFKNVWLFLCARKKRKIISQTKAAIWIQRWTRLTRHEF